MTGEMFRTFLNAGIAVCALMALTWLLRIRSRGATAWLMLGAFGVLGTLLYALSVEAQAWVLLALSASLGALLIADFVVRAGRAAQGGPR